MIIQQLKGEYAVRRVCSTLDVALSSAYYKVTDATDTSIVEAVEQILMQFPFYGYRKVGAELKRRGMAVSEYQVRQVLRTLGVSRTVGKLRVQTTDSNHAHPRYPNRIRGVEPTRPDQIWVADISYIRLGKRFIYLAVILDAFTRAVRGWALSRRVDLQLTLAALDMALQKAIPFIFHSDQGSQYAAWEHTDRLLSLGVKISMSDKGCPTQNGIAERFMRTLKEEHVDYTEYTDFEDAFQQIKHWLEVTYMTQRIHQSLDYVTPAEFEVAALAQLGYPLL